MGRSTWYPGWFAAPVCAASPPAAQWGSPQGTHMERSASHSQPGCGRTAPKRTHYAYIYITAETKKCIQAAWLLRFLLCLPLRSLCICHPWMCADQCGCAWLQGCQAKNAGMWGGVGQHGDLLGRSWERDFYISTDMAWNMAWLDMDLALKHFDFADKCLRINAIHCDPYYLALFFCFFWKAGSESCQNLQLFVLQNYGAFRWEDMSLYVSVCWP